MHFVDHGTNDILESFYLSVLQIKHVVDKLARMPTTIHFLYLKRRIVEAIFNTSLQHLLCHGSSVPHGLKHPPSSLNHPCGILAILHCTSRQPATNGLLDETSRLELLIIEQKKLRPIVYIMELRIEPIGTFLRFNVPNQPWRKLNIL